MSFNWQHLVLTLASATAAGATAWAHYDPNHQLYAYVLLGIAGSVVTSFGLTSSSVLAPAVPVVAPVAPEAPPAGK